MDTRRSKVMRAKYTAGLSCSVAGTAMGLLALTNISMAAGGGHSGGVTTAVLLSLIALATAGFVPLVPMVCRRFGVRRSYVASILVGAGIWAALAALVPAGSTSFGVVCLSGALLGVVLSAATVLKPLFAQIFLGGASMSVSYARQSLISGVAWVAGALVGGLLIETVGPGWTLLLNAGLSLPLALVLGRTTLTDEPTIQPRGQAGAHSTLSYLRANRGVRVAVLVAASTVVFIGPMTLMVVPLADAFRQSPVTGAGLLMASMGLGRICTPTLVGRLNARLTSIDGAMIADFAGGVILIVFAACSTVVSGGLELAVWCVIGACFGAARFSARAFTVGAAVDSAAQEHRVEAMSALVLVALLATPVGLLLWGTLLDVSGPQVTLLVVGFGMLLAVALLRSARPTLGAARPD